jgi:hypothetical protein
MPVAGSYQGRLSSIVTSFAVFIGVHDLVLIPGMYVYLGIAASRFYLLEGLYCLRARPTFPQLLEQISGCMLPHWAPCLAAKPCWRQLGMQPPAGNAHQVAPWEVEGACMPPVFALTRWANHVNKWQDLRNGDVWHCSATHVAALISKAVGKQNPTQRVPLSNRPAFLDPHGRQHRGSCRASNGNLPFPCVRSALYLESRKMRKLLPTT